MLLSEVSLIELLPLSFRSDRIVQGLSSAADFLLEVLLIVGRILPINSRIDEQDETILDEMAVALNLKWYDRNATNTQKRSIIKSAEIVYRQLGTAAAVEQVAKDYFGAAEVEEYWQYGGSPGHFRIKIQAQNLTGSQIDAFATSIRWVKRVSAELDAITTVDPLQGILYTGGAYHGTATQHLLGGD
jgi:phage tail P2-like protein